MPVISTFYGIVVLMYYFDDRRHHLPHIHVQYSDEEAVLEIPSGVVLEGKIKTSNLKLVFRRGSRFIRKNCWRTGVLQSKASEYFGSNRFGR